MGIRPLVVATVALLGTATGCKKSCEPRSVAEYMDSKDLSPTMPSMDRTALTIAMMQLSGGGRVCNDDSGRPEISFESGDVASVATALDQKLSPTGWTRKPGDGIKDGRLMVAYEKRAGTGPAATMNVVTFFISPSRAKSCRTGTVCIQ